MSVGPASKLPGFLPVLVAAALGGDRVRQVAVEREPSDDRARLVARALRSSAVSVFTIRSWLVRCDRKNLIRSGGMTAEIEPEVAQNCGSKWSERRIAAFARSGENDEYASSTRSQSARRFRVVCWPAK